VLTDLNLVGFNAMTLPWGAMSLSEVGQKERQSPSGDMNETNALHGTHRGHIGLSEGKGLRVGRAVSRVKVLGA
jgi:hypothetical protein